MKGKDHIRNVLWTNDHSMLLHILCKKSCCSLSFSLHHYVWECRWCVIYHLSTGYLLANRCYIRIWLKNDFIQKFCTSSLGNWKRFVYLLEMVILSCGCTIGPPGKVLEIPLNKMCLTLIRTFWGMDLRHQVIPEYSLKGHYFHLTACIWRTWY